MLLTDMNQPNHESKDIGFCTSRIHPEIQSVVFWNAGVAKNLANGGKFWIAGRCSISEGLSGTITRCSSRWDWSAHMPSTSVANWSWVTRDPRSAAASARDWWFRPPLKGPCELFANVMDRRSVNCLAARRSPFRVSFHVEWIASGIMKRRSPHSCARV